MNLQIAPEQWYKVREAYSVADVKQTAIFYMKKD